MNSPNGLKKCKMAWIRRLILML